MRFPLTLQLPFRPDVRDPDTTEALREQAFTQYFIVPLMVLSVGSALGSLGLLLALVWGVPAAG